MMQIESLCKSCERMGQCFYETPEITVTGCSRYVKRKPRTNGDRIRAMTDEVDLAIFLDSVKTDGRLNGGKYPYSKFGWLDWLRQEVQDNGSIH